MKIQIGDEVRDMTEKEQADYKAAKAEMEANLAALQTAAAAKASARAKLKALGLTDAEIAALVG